MQRRRSVQDLDLSLALRAEVALSKIALVSSASVADLGCATGAFAARLADRGLSVTCVDISAANLAELERLHPNFVEQGRLRPVQASLTSLPIDSGSLDAVFCMEVLEHVDDDRGALREIQRVLAPGGTLILSVPNRAGPKPVVERLGLESVHDAAGPERHVREGYGKEELSRLLTDAGLDPTWLGGVGGGMYRLTVGAVSIVHLAIRRGRGQTSWTWADVERDSGSTVMKIYGLVFPILLRLARLSAVVRTPRASTLMVTAVRR